MKYPNPYRPKRKARIIDHFKYSSIDLYDISRLQENILVIAILLNVVLWTADLATGLIRLTT